MAVKNNKLPIPGLRRRGNFLVRLALFVIIVMITGLINLWTGYEAGIKTLLSGIITNVLFTCKYGDGVSTQNVGRYFSVMPILYIWKRKKY